MAELKVLKCPNCGANTTNAQNCEYCGSLLVRFVDKGIDLSTTNYLSDKMTIPGLATELKKNLQLQKTTDEIVTTDIYSYSDVTEAHYPEMSVVRTGYGKYGYTDKPIVINGNKSGLVIVYERFDILNPEDESGYDKQVEEFHNECFKEFMSLPSYPLFTQHVEQYCDYDYDTGKKIYKNNSFYAIDFGEDADGAARLISEIIAIPIILCCRGEGKEFKGFTDKYLFFTNIGEANIKNSRDSIDNADDERFYDSNPDLKPNEENGDGMSTDGEDEEYALEDNSKVIRNAKITMWVSAIIGIPLTVLFVMFLIMNPGGYNSSELIDSILTPDSIRFLVAAVLFDFLAIRAYRKLKALQEEN